MRLKDQTQMFSKVRIGPAGVHIFDRSTGLNILVDEVKTNESEWSLAPRQVSIALTNACELSCPYCYAPKRPASLDFCLLTTWLEELDENGCLGIGFGGGEPTLYRQFSEICRFAAENTNLAVTFTTHGHNLDEGLIARLNGRVHFLRISMDGVGPTYEALRGRPFSSLLHRIRIAKSLAPFGINYVVNKQTIADLDRAISIAVNLGASEFLLLPEKPVNSQGGIDDCTLENLREWIECYSGRIPLTISEANASGISVANPFANESGLRGFAHIDARGLLKRTSYDIGGQPIGASGVIGALSLLNEEKDRN